MHTDKPLPPLPANHRYTSKAISFSDGHAILSDYCNTCTRSESCRLLELLCQAMGENFPYWPRQFKFVTASLEKEQGSDAPSFDDRMTKPVCLAYRNPQRPLPGVPTQHTDAIYRVKEILSPEVARRKAFLEEQEALWAEMTRNHTHYGNKHTRENACHL